MEIEKEVLALMGRCADLECQIEQITELRIQVAEFEARMAAIGDPSRPVPKWDDLGHRHVEDEFAGVSG